MEARARIPVAPPINKPLPSYWQDPKSPLANVIEPETDHPSRPYDHVIIGSGISGTMIAYNLLQTHPDARIVMLEAREICSGATGRNGGHTKAATYRSYKHFVQELGRDEALKIARLEYANIVETHRMAKELDIDCESNLCNTIDAIYDQKTFEEGKAAIEALRADATKEETDEHQMAWYKIYEKGEDDFNSFHLATQNSNPAAKEKEELTGIFEYLAGRIHGYQFVTGVLQKCVRKGLLLCTNTPVHALLPSEKQEGGTTSWDVFTQHNTFRTRNVILATNGYTAHLLQAIQGAIVPMRGQITVQRPGISNKLTTPLLTTYSFIHRSSYEYMIPRPLKDGTQHIVIGGGLGCLPEAGATEYGHVDDSSLNETISQYLKGALIGYFGKDNWGETSSDERIFQEWTGIMGATADGRPFVGEVPEKNGLWISAGFNGHGMVLCLKSAEALASMIDGRETPEWFPESFLICTERLEKCKFNGRTDMGTSSS